MKISQTLLLIGFILIEVLTQSAFCGPTYFHRARHRVRGHLPKYDYKTSQPRDVVSVTSQLGIPGVTRTQNASLATVNRKSFVFDDVSAGPINVYDLTGEHTNDGNILVTGTALHSGGIAGQLLGGKLRIRLEALSSTGITQSTSLKVAVREYECWVRQNEPEAIYLTINQDQDRLHSFQTANQIRLVFEYHPNR